MQTMRDQQQLIKLQIDLGAAFRGVGLVKKILFVSHRWEYPGNPDPDGVQFSKVKEYLHDHPEIEFIWFDFSCMPQRESETVDRRTSAELDEFQNMLSAIADLYLTSRVLILLDNTYKTRFWTTTGGLVCHADSNCSWSANIDGK